MALLRLISILLFSSLAHAGGEVGYTKGYLLENNTDTNRYYFSIYENVYKDIYINPYFEYMNSLNLKQNYTKLDINKHVNNKLILGIGISNTSNNWNTFTEVKGSVVYKLW